MMGFFQCFSGCFRGAHAEPAEDVVAVGKVTADDWQSVPDDVLQAVLTYLNPADVAAARLACRNWRLLLSGYTEALHLPLSFLATKQARAVLRRTGKVFPSLREVRLSHVDGWCDPVQARMDLEPLVRLESRLVSLAPLAAGFPRLSRLTLVDANFTRDPWPLGELCGLGTGLTSLQLLWDTALWAPGQVLQEWEALQGVFALTQLRSLTLDKCAYAFLGEAALADSCLAAATALGALTSLSLTSVKITDQGFQLLALLPQLQQLRLSGQLQLSLRTLHDTFARLLGLTELHLGKLQLSNDDLAAMVMAHRDAAAAAASGIAGASSAGAGAPDAAPPGGGDDWSTALLPLQQLRRLHLHSDVSLLGGSAALRGLRALSEVSLQAGAKFLPAGAGAGNALPPSWFGGGGGGGGDGGWRALRSLHVDRLQLADGFVEAAAQLTGLRTLIVSGPCLLTPAAPPPPPPRPSGGAARVAPGGGGVGGRSGGGGGRAARSSSGDQLTQLASLLQLSKFEMHVQAQTPPAMLLSNYTLAHLASCWSQLTSLSFCVTHAPAAEPLCALSLLGALLDLSMTCLDGGYNGSTHGGDGGGGGGMQLVDWRHLPPRVVSLSLVGFNLQNPDLLTLASAAPQLRHLRLMHCALGDDQAAVVAYSWPRLSSLVLKEGPLAGVGAAGLAAVSGMAQLRCLAVMLLPAADVRPLGQLTQLRYLLLDGRSNAEVVGAKALRLLTSLRCLVLPLLHLHHESHAALLALQAALPSAALYNISGSFGLQHGCQWFEHFQEQQREWWREPTAPWRWCPTLHIRA